MCAIEKRPPILGPLELGEPIGGLVPPLQFRSGPPSPRSTPPHSSAPYPPDEEGGFDAMDDRGPCPPALERSPSRSRCVYVPTGMSRCLRSLRYDLGKDGQEPASVHVASLSFAIGSRAVCCMISSAGDGLLGWAERPDRRAGPKGARMHERRAGVCPPPKKVMNSRRCMISSAGDGQSRP